MRSFWIGQQLLPKCCPKYFVEPCHTLNRWCRRDRNYNTIFYEYMKSARSSVEKTCYFEHFWKIFDPQYASYQLNEWCYANDIFYAHFMDPNECFYNIRMVLRLIFMKCESGTGKKSRKQSHFHMWGGRCYLYVDQRSTSVDFFENPILKCSKMLLNFFRTKELN